MAPVKPNLVDTPKPLCLWFLIHNTQIYLFLYWVVGEVNKMIESCRVRRGVLLHKDVIIHGGQNCVRILFLLYTHNAMIRFDLKVPSIIALCQNTLSFHSIYPLEQSLKKKKIMKKVYVSFLATPLQCSSQSVFLSGQFLFF